MEKRKATLEDIPFLAEIENKYFHSPWTKEQFEQEMKENEFSHIYVLIDKNIIIGYIDYWIIFDQAQINKICIENEYRRQGLAKYLILQAFIEMKKNEVFSITLEVRVSNISAQKLYESLGFKKILIKNNYYSDGEDAFFMMKGGHEI